MYFFPVFTINVVFSQLRVICHICAKLYRQFELEKHVFYDHGKHCNTDYQCEICSEYLFDETDKKYVLMATKGLRQQSIGKVRLAMGEGLVGLVAAKEEPLNLQDADKHPNFAFFEEIQSA